jgi:hypothetical protein
MLLVLYWNYFAALLDQSFRLFVSIMPTLKIPLKIFLKCSPQPDRVFTSHEILRVILTKFYRLQGQIPMILTKFDPVVEILMVKSSLLEI